MHPNTSRNANVFTGYGENSGFVQLMGVNSCGAGAAVSLAVEHGNCSGPGCGGIPVAPPNPVPNSADDEFKLDFRTYPEGTYYIYIYDQYSNTIYQSEASNIEKTVETSNIPNGIYYLHIHTGTTVDMMQLQINH